MSFESFWVLFSSSLLGMTAFSLYSPYTSTARFGPCRIVYICTHAHPIEGGSSMLAKELLKHVPMCLWEYGSLCHRANVHKYISMRSLTPVALVSLICFFANLFFLFWSLKYATNIHYFSPKEWLKVIEEKETLMGSCCSARNLNTFQN